jgi:hypothetical protein
MRFALHIYFRTICSCHCGIASELDLAVGGRPVRDLNVPRLLATSLRLVDFILGQSAPRRLNSIALP